MNYERKQQLIKEFKTSFHNKEFRPSYAELGHKIEGKLIFEVFIFYAMLRNKNIEKTTHDVKSEKFLDIIYNLKSDFNKKYIFKNVKYIFPSLTDIEFEEIITEYFK